MASIKVGDVNLYYELRGNIESNETLVFLNGIMSSVSSWNNQYPVLKKHFKILLYNYNTSSEIHTYKDHAHDLKALLEHLEINKVHLIGASFGGVVGMQFTLLYPDYVKSLSLIDTISELDELLKATVTNWKTLLINEPYDFYHKIIPSFYSNDFIENNQLFLDNSAKSYAKIPEEFFVEQIHLLDTFIENTNLTEALPNILCPTLIICGEEDVLTPRKFSDRIAELIKNNEYVIIPKCGHVSLIEKPSVINSLLLGFISKNN